MAEVLVTLAILGVVAAITIPTLVNHYQKEQYVIGLKKAYTQFNQALSEISDDNGCANDLKCTDIFDAGTTDKSLGDELIKYFKVTKNCGITLGKDCFPAKTNEFYDGSSASYYEFNNWVGYRFITVDGMAYYVWNYAQNCTQDDSTGVTGDLKQACGEIYVDVNGPSRGPNTLGRDTFNLWISNGKGATLYPMGGADTKWSNQNWWWKDPIDETKLQHCYPGEKTSWPCAGRVVEEGWKMNY